MLDINSWTVAWLILITIVGAVFLRSEYEDRQKGGMSLSGMLKLRDILALLGIVLSPYIYSMIYHIIYVQAFNLDIDIFPLTTERSYEIILELLFGDGAFYVFWVLVFVFWAVATVFYKTKILQSKQTKNNAVGVFFFAYIGFAFAFLIIDALNERFPFEQFNYGIVLSVLLIPPLVTLIVYLSSWIKTIKKWKYEKNRGFFISAILLGIFCYCMLNIDMEIPKNKSTETKLVWYEGLLPVVSTILTCSLICWIENISKALTKKSGMIIRGIFLMVLLFYVLFAIKKTLNNSQVDLIYLTLLLLLFLLFLSDFFGKDIFKVEKSSKSIDVWEAYESTISTSNNIRFVLGFIAIFFLPVIIFILYLAAPYKKAISEACKIKKLEKTVSSRCIYVEGNNQKNYKGIKIAMTDNYLAIFDGKAVTMLGSDKIYKSSSSYTMKDIEKDCPSTDSKKKTEKNSQKSIDTICKGL